MKRLACLCAVISLGLLWSSCSEERRPNIILISLDDLRADHLGCYGYARDTSPFMDSLADQGVLFERTVAQDTWTLPSHISLLSSMYVEAHGVRTLYESLSASSPTLLQELLRTQGYRTMAFTTVDFISPLYKMDRGFDHFQCLHLSAKDLNPIVLDHLDSVKEQPFFLFLHYYDIHCPFSEENPYGKNFASSRTYAVQERFEEAKTLLGRKFSEIREEELIGLEKMGLIDLAVFREKQRKFPDRLIAAKHLRQFEGNFLRQVNSLAQEDLAALKDHYDDGIAFMDYYLAELFARLKDYSWYKDTVVIITSDHGEAFNEHPGHIGHGGPPYQEQAEVPGILFGKGVPQGKRIPAAIASIDLAPTLLDLAGIDIPRFYQGRSLLELIRTGKPLKPRPILSGWLDKECISLQQGRWKIVYDPFEKRYALFDLESPEGENRDVALEHPKEVERMQMILEKNEARNKKIGAGHSAISVELNEETRDRLRALGY